MYNRHEARQCDIFNSRDGQYRHFPENDTIINDVKKRVAAIGP